VNSIPILTDLRWKRESSIRKIGYLSFNSTKRVKNQQALWTIFLQTTTRLIQQLWWGTKVEVTFKSPSWMIDLRVDPPTYQTRRLLSWCSIEDKSHKMTSMEWTTHWMRLITISMASKLMPFTIYKYLIKLKVCPFKDSNKFKLISQSNTCSLSTTNRTL
jgi:hypothetical protein